MGTKALPTLYRRNLKTEDFHSENASVNVFSPKYAGTKFKNGTITCHFGSEFEDEGREITWLLWRHRFRNAPFSKCFPFTQKRKAAFSNSSGLKNVFEKLRFRNGLVWTVGLTVEIKQRF